MKRSRRMVAIFFLILIFSGGLENAYQIYRSEPSEGCILQQWMNELPFQTFFIELNGAYEKLLGKQIVFDSEDQYTVLKLENDYLTFISDVYSQEENAQSLRKFCEWVRAAGRDFLYIQSPHKIDKYDTMLPDWISDGCNQNADQLIELAEVPVLDLRDKIYEDGLSHYDLFFKTDHHWTPEAALWAAQSILERLNRLYGYEFELLQLDAVNFNTTSYHETYLGSQGKRVGRIFSGIDDFISVEPKIQSDLYEVFVPKLQYRVSGSFSEVLFQREIAASHDLYKANNYQSYMSNGDGTGLQEIRNLSNPDGPRLILFRDSFASAVVPFLASYFGEIDLIDLRYCDAIDLSEYFADKSPDIVAIMYNPDLLGWGVPFHFQYETAEG